MDIWDGIVIGTASSLIAALLVYKFFNVGPVGGDTPSQLNAPNNPNFGQARPLVLYDLPPTPDGASPVVQVNPITEAAYNQQPVEYVNAFGPTVGQPAEGNHVLMPM